MLPHGEKYHTFPSLHPRRRRLRASTPVYLSVPLRTASFVRTRSRRSAPLSHAPHRLENGTGQRKNVRRISRAKGRKDGLFSGLFRHTLRTQRPRFFRTARFRPVATGRFFQDRRSTNIPNKPPYRSVGTQRHACLAAPTGSRQESSRRTGIEGSPRRIERSQTTKGLVTGIRPQRLHGRTAHP